MKLYLDCEFNEFKGALISMALVDENGREWYEVVPCEKPGPWVAEHVMPILGRGPVSIPLMQASLSAWLALYDSVHIVADWPEDIAHFCQALITGPGMRLNTPPLTMEVVRIDAESELPHNALADARGIRAALAAREAVPANAETATDNEPAYVTLSEYGAICALNTLAALSDENESARAVVGPVIADLRIALCRPWKPARPQGAVPRWRCMDDAPDKTGRYIVAHAGMVGGDAYFTAKEGDTHYPVGWSQVPHWKPTHWLDCDRSTMLAAAKEGKPS